MLGFSISLAKKSVSSNTTFQLANQLINGQLANQATQSLNKSPKLVVYLSVKTCKNPKFLEDFEDLKGTIDLRKD